MSNPKQILKLNDLALTSIIRTTSHRFSQDAFKLLESKEAHLSCKVITDDLIELTYQFNPALHKNLDHFLKASHIQFSCLIMSLNIATIGYFNWAVQDNSVPFYSLIEFSSDKQLGSMSFKHNHAFPALIEDLTDSDFKRAILIFGVLAKNFDSVFVQDYIKGIMHLNWDYIFFEFRKEAFGNFYRVIENIAAEHILKVEKLGNEQKQIKQALLHIGAHKDIVEEFDAIYKLRSNQIMHAQKKQVVIDLEDVYKIKSILDHALYLYFKPIWTTKMLEIRKKRSDRSGNNNHQAD